MANNLVFNPLRVDTAGTIISDSKGDTLIQAIQWVNDSTSAAGSIGENDNMTLKLNGVAIQLRVAVAESLSGALAYNLHLDVPLRTFELVVSQIDGGTLLIWKA